MGYNLSRYQNQAPTSHAQRRQNMSGSSSYIRAALICGMSKCPYNGDGDNIVIIEIKNPETLTEEDTLILNKLIEAPKELTSEEFKRLDILLPGQRYCPIHGSKNLGYATTQEITVTAVFVINADGGVDGPMDDDGS